MKPTTLLALICGLIILSTCRSLPDKTTTTKIETPTTFVPINLATKTTSHPLGIDLDEFLFQWEIPVSTGKQTSYQILVASDAKKLAADVGDVWNSGRRYTLDHNNILYLGKPFKTEQDIWWKVKVWDKDDKESPFSSPSQIQNIKNDKSIHRIAFLGGTLISRMEKDGWLETLLTVNYPRLNLSFRNLGWPADDVFGTARSEFGSALNTKSWKPPDPEEGYGFEVLKEHIELADPDMLMLGYGAEAAFIDNEKDWELFVNGYEQLLTELEANVPKLILLSPHQHWKIPNADQNNQRLKRAADMIEELAEKRGHRFIDLYETLGNLYPSIIITDNGIHLNKRGYDEMAGFILKELHLLGGGYELNLSKEGKILASKGVQIDNFVSTTRGFRFDLLSDHNIDGSLTIPSEHLVKVNGKIARERRTSGQMYGKSDSLQFRELQAMIIEKNRLHRLRINPLNKVYTHLFRQHEMGHLAYETDDYRRLVEEKEELIAMLRVPKTHRYEVELLEPWKSPREYPDHEVPESIPGPDIEKELAAFTVAEGFELNLFASDPMIANPISITWDNRGRAWVATSTTYPQIKPGLEPIDRIVILEDADQDGVADKSTIFAEGLLIPHSVMPVEGGAYVFTSTEFLFLADHDGDDKADETRVIYSGFGHGDVHHTIHCAKWAPWGDMYFSQSININSFVETAYGPRKLNGSGFWQFRPETERLEIFVRGMINPWGQAFDDWGQIFATDGAGGEGPSYLFPGSAHRTAVGVDRILPGLMKGKPKFTAAEIMNGSHIPEHWQGSLLTSDFRANRTVRLNLTENGSGYAAEEVETVLHSSHRSYRPVDIKHGPDGAVYIVDWYSPIIDHGEVDFYHPARDKSHGRIWRLAAKNKPLNPIQDLSKASIDELLDLLKSSEQFIRLQSNRELVRRKIAPEKVKSWVNNLNSKDKRVDHHRVEALWLGIALNSPDQALLKKVLTSSNHRARAAATRMIPRFVEVDENEKLLAQLITDKHPQVRLEAVNALRILAFPNAVDLALRALDYPMDENLDYALWLTVRELEKQWLPALSSGKMVFGGNFQHLAFALNAANNSEATKSLAQLVKKGQLNKEEEQGAFITIANLGGGEELEMVLGVAAEREDVSLLNALANASSTNKSVPEKAEILLSLMENENSEIRTVAAKLLGRWKVDSVSELLVRQASNTKAGISERMAAVDALASLGKFDLLKTLSQNNNTSIRATAISAWAKVEPQKALTDAMKLLMQTTSTANAKLIIGTYCNIKGGAEMMKNNLTGKQINSEVALTGIRVAQSSGRNLSGLINELTRAGSIKPLGNLLNPAQRKKLISDAKSNGSSYRGKQIYERVSLVCTTCHQVNGKGGKVGPDLSSLGSYMTPESILESLINPSTSIKQGYETVIITKKDGQVISGTLDRKTEQSARVKDASGKIITIPNEEIDKLEVSTVSIMPPGLTGSLRQDELADLMKYLMNLGK